ncbi:adenylyltransferase/cytidyltransferase family protein [Pseudalkalibacillus sp. A8]|uniref:adenylyltransferase/cytidyltransferase family protein n=1 Tax=Pseudalkalibacillus sp. A8 TaxID=3382641 RepID=UPI0038B5BFC7
MKTIHVRKDNLSYWQQSSEQLVVALGNFDGLHRGHCKVIETAKKIADKKELSLAVMSFFPHPKAVLGKGDDDFPYLMPLNKKVKILREMGVENFYIVEFTKNFASLSPEAFIEEYLINLGVQHVVAGFDFTYGCKGAGNMDKMKDYVADRIDITKVDKVVHRGEKIGSTGLRRRILAGHLEEVPYFLKRNYKTYCSWDGTVLKPDAYYIVPDEGTYYVTLKDEERVYHTSVQIVREGNHKILRCSEKNLLMPTGNVIVEWHNRVTESRVVTV